MSPGHALGTRSAGLKPHELPMFRRLVRTLRLSVIRPGSALTRRFRGRPHALGADVAPRRRRRGLTWRGILAILIVFVAVEGVVGAAGAMLFAWSGAYDVAATAEHWPITRWILHYTMRHSVAARAGSRNPPNLDDPQLIALGAAHYATGCAPCHGEPGGPASPIASGMTPVPPRLDWPVYEFTADELHWIVKHGIKMTAMPAWPAQQRDDEVWAMVAFLKAAPTMKPDQYRTLAWGPDGKVGRDTCSRCHGEDGNGRDGFPKIAGLSYPYIVEALKEFRTGTRHSGFMQPVAARLSDDEIDGFARYFSGKERKPAKTPAVPPDVLAHGQALAVPSDSVRSSAACLSCHVTDASKRSPTVPDIAGQDPAYLAEQLRLFRSGVRSETKSAQIMVRAAKMLTDQDIEAVSAYVASLPASPSKAGGS